jgi:hypothetical protein
VTHKKKSMHNLVFLVKVVSLMFVLQKNSGRTSVLLGSRQEEEAGSTWVALDFLLHRSFLVDAR